MNKCESQTFNIFMPNIPNNKIYQNYIKLFKLSIK